MILLVDLDDDEVIGTADYPPAARAARLVSGADRPVAAVVDRILLLPRHLEDGGAVGRTAFAAPGPERRHC